MKASKQFRHQRRIVDGVLLLDKPRGLTSNAALQTARRLLNAAKAGHTGTLDPMATGLLPLTLGEATKFSQMLLDADKAYEATVRLGIETDTGDAEGAAIATAPVHVTDDSIRQALAALTGEIEQVPPMYSALKRDGKPLYEYARAGIEVERAARPVTIHSLELLGVEGDSLRIRVDCSKGTYVRTLAIDLGRLLGCGGHLTELRRTRIGPFNVDEAVTLTALEALPAESRVGLLAPVDALVGHLPRIELDAFQAGLLLQGRVLAAPCGAAGLVRIYGEGRYLGLGECDGNGTLSPKRLVSTVATAQQS
ncbi:tRNA pseudouridine(55) synthase TruB [Aromatoleum aromaticum]|uniref:tRNA pseudouridine synthase B n=1 Tax=Aromatoleum aromaticum (strain DSM 19018 / LMG 30748 / EbN1) TaxID=76114 RepID=TRUB_AROAE|nr:tRNA pseudouridine(55) synthase TruB [Aromatoleum aromaticum]Q5NZR9.1 RecName: Full=tRNA pseudouridine synthase B; AltName: Full=tRNA pseudouridine(55) synthase; Short=Psi55 synthase; AltName: Full=tRNA pseudouridylate synthase; AltName: Full=tRNA-uridine isomerase [Aromatoleum aromaticum EbN1]NMG56384.1 tRNA pseudouridine(55) synthase TruB [Aromatoleum aromaticum]CAI09445.1 tRNA pseudouridine 55 synthase [Aromatoleum aromaticum EbN1]